MIDTLLDSPMELILPKLPLAPDLKDALLGGTSTVSQILDLVTAYEHAEWSFVDRLADEFAQHEERLATAYRRAVASATALAA